VVDSTSDDAVAGEPNALRAVLDQLLAPLTDALVTIGLDGRIRYASPAVRHLTGFDPHTLHGQPYDAFVHPDDLLAADDLGDAPNAPDPGDGDDGAGRGPSDSADGGGGEVDPVDPADPVEEGGDTARAEGAGDPSAVFDTRTRRELDRLALIRPSDGSGEPPTVRIRHADGDWRRMVVLSRRSPGSDEASRSYLLRNAEDHRPALDALRHRLAFEDLLTRVAFLFIHRAAHEVGASVAEALADIGRFAHADRAYVYLVHDERGLVEATHEWVAPGIVGAHSQRRTVPSERFPQWLATLREGEPVYLPSVAVLGEDWAVERQHLERLGARSVLAVPITDDGRLAGFIGFDLVSAERFWSDDHIALLSATAGLISQARARSDAEQRFGLAFDRAPLGMALHNEEGVHIQVNPAFAELLGKPADELVGTSILDYIVDEDRQLLVTEHRRLLTGDCDQLTMELRFDRARPSRRSPHHPSRRDVDAGDPPERGGDADGAHEMVWCRVHSAAVRSDDGSLRYTVSHVEDITERVRRDAELRASEERFRTLVTALKRSEAELAHQALHDPLTGLANRALLLDFLERNLARRETPGNSPAVLFIDLDRFKVVNDSLGHRAGDQLLVAVAERLSSVARPSDLIARLGGDEFVVVLESIDDASEAVRVAERIKEALAVPISVSHSEAGHTEVVATGSLGIAMPTMPGADAEGLLRDADAAMYLAKSNGRNRFEIFDTVLRTQAMEKLQMEAAMRRALDAGGFEVHYQPEVDLRTGDIVGFEALVRWNHPAQGWLAAWSFIELAEETGLIVELGAWVLAEACRQAGAWRRDHPDRPTMLRVNLSGRQFTQHDLVAQVVAALDAGDVPASSLCLEITETALMADPGNGLRILNDLRALGVTLAIDDFGTGYSSLAYLKRFPVDVLKIDRSFVDGLGEDPDDTAIATAIISLAASLGLRVVAEGVETPRQLDELRRLGCDRAQGFLFAHALPAADAFALDSPHPRAQPAATAR
jgi:diguanylate cyclase (GGDEF)-like protein/PAS domain S-box-containing protein